MKNHPVLEEAIKIQNKKSKDYGAVDYAKSDYFPFDDKSYLTMLHIKMQRLMNLVDSNKTNFESKYDSVIDLINYASFYGAYLLKQKDEK